MRKVRVFIFTAMTLVYFLYVSLASAMTTPEILPQWAKSTVIGGGTSWGSTFNAAATDSNGNIYVVGFISEAGTYDFGNGVTATGVSAYRNLILVKYSRNGQAQWARSVTAGTSGSDYYSVAVDSNGNVYAAGSIYGTDVYNFGNGVTVTGIKSGEYSPNAVIVKYDNYGNAQWAKSVTSGTGSSRYNSIVLDSSNNIYVAGFIDGNSAFYFGGVVVTGSSVSNNSVIVKYDINGNAKGATTNISGTHGLRFSSITVDTSGNIYAVGEIFNTDAYNFGNAITVAGTSEGNIVLVKYDNNLTAQWARSVTAGTQGNESVFNSVAADSNGNIYAVGYIIGSNTYNFGNGITAVGANAGGRNIVLVKYDNDGNTQWAKGVSTGLSASMFSSIAIDSNNNIYASGYIAGTGDYNFGNDITVAGSYSAGNNGVLVKYDNNGEVQFAESVATGPSISEFNSVVIDPTGNAYVVGNIAGTGTYDFGDKVTVTASCSSHNILLVKYSPNILSSSSSATKCAAVSVGDAYVGGTVFCISQTPDITKCVITGSGRYGLIMANEDQVNYNSNSNHGIMWSSACSPSIGASSLDNGTANTAAIISAFPTDNSNNNAAWLCHSYTGGGCADWYLPSKNELNKMYLYGQANNLIGTDCSGSKVDGVQCLVGGYSYIGYWSSSENSDSAYSCDVWIKPFIDSGWAGNGEMGYNYMGVRAVRIFSNAVKPLIDNVYKSEYENTIIRFTETDFSSNFSACGNSLAMVKIVSLPAHGILRFSNTAITANQEISVSEISNLMYIPDSNYTGTDSFTWNGSDGLLYSDNYANVNIAISAIHSQSVSISSSSSAISNLPSSSQQEQSSSHYSSLPSSASHVEGSSFSSTITEQTPNLIDFAKLGFVNTDIVFTATDFQNNFNGYLGNRLTKIKVTDLPSSGILTLAGVSVTANQEILMTDITKLRYTPGSNFSGQDNFKWNGSDGYLYAKNSAYVNISIVNPASSRSSSAGIFVSSFTKIGAMNTDIKFTVLDFINNFNGTLIKIKIIALPTNGALKLFGNVVTVGQEIYVRELGGLVFTPYSDWNGVTAFIWNGSDGEVYAENPATVTIEVNGAVSSATTIKPFSFW